MRRFGCFEISTSCGSCGQPLPVNGPYRKLLCINCLEETPVSPDRIAGFLNDLEEEYEGLAEGQGRGGTLMSGSGTFKYSYWRLEPRCYSCKKPLTIPEKPDNAVIKCSECGALSYVFPAPDWLLKKVPSARYFCTPQPYSEKKSDKNLEIDESSEKPIVISCPKCAGALTVSAQSERIMKCEYCNSEVYVPDSVWRRLHPVRKTEEWFVSFEGKNRKQLESERRVMDEKEEKEELRKWHSRNVTEKAGSKFRSFPGILLKIIIVAVAVGIFNTMLGNDYKNNADFWSRYITILTITLSILIPLWMVFQTMFSSKIGNRKKCKQAMARLAKKHGWKHEAAEYKSTLGYINAEYLGRDIEIHPGDDYAVEVDINNSPFYIKTEPPGYPQDSVQRFTTGDERFDNLFPIRYATAELAEKIEKSPEEARLVLAPVYWFLDRWRNKLGRFRIDYSDAAVHMTHSYSETWNNSNRYVLGEDLEPLLEDMMVLSAGIDAIAGGKDPELPRSHID